MIRRITASQVDELLKLPESGMGYQFIEAETGIHNVKSKFLVLNAEIIIDDSSLILNEVKTVFKSGYRLSVNMANDVQLKNIRLVENLSNYSLKSQVATAQTGAIHNKKEIANGYDVFTRLSAYDDDKRIDKSNKKLLPESFTTTQTDYNYCKSNGLNPVERYALPNDEEIKWAFHIRPRYGDILQRGIVEPANNQPGGGVEDYFENGTSNLTVLEQTAY